MSQETIEALNSNILVGYGRGAWWTNDRDHPNLFDGAVPEDRLLRLFGWNVVEVPITYTPELPMGVEGPERLVTTPKKILYRGDTGGYLGVVGHEFVIHPYVDTLYGGLVARGIIGDRIGVASAGLLQSGGQAWVSLQVPESTTTPEGVEFRPQLLCYTSLNGTLSTGYMPVSTLTVCDNTFRIARQEGAKSARRVRHTKNSAAMVESAMDALKGIYAEQEGTAATIKALCETPITNAQWSDFLSLHFPEGESKRSQTVAATNRERVTAMRNTDPRCEAWRGTAFGVIQVMNTDTQWNTPVRKRDGETVDRPSWQMEKVIDGSFATADDRVFENLRKVLASV